jgi:hypothetical protein
VGLFLFPGHHTEIAVVVVVIIIIIIIIIRNSMTDTPGNDIVTVEGSSPLLQKIPLVVILDPFKLSKPISLKSILILSSRPNNRLLDEE